jgi:hypothetical protein
MVMKIQVEVFWVVMLCSAAVGYQGEDRGSKVFQNVSILPHHYTASQPVRL